MSDTSGWPDGIGYRWLEALELAAAPWARPLLEVAGLPASVFARQDLLADIADRARAEREMLLQSVKQIENFPGLDGAVTREVVVRAVHRLAEALSSDDARAFEQWARRHFVGEHRQVLLPWQFVLTRFLVNPSESGVPDVLESLRGQLESLLGNEAEREIYARLRKIAPPPSDADRELGLDFAAPAEQLKEVIDNERTLAALRLIRRNSEPSQRRAISEWASGVARALGLPADVADSDALERSFDFEAETAEAQSALSMPLPK